MRAARVLHTGPPMIEDASALLGTTVDRESASPAALRSVVAGAGMVLRLASQILTGVKRLWKRVPLKVREGVHVAVDSTGVPYVLNYLASYDQAHQPDNFAGNLIVLDAAYAGSSGDERAKLERQFKGILDALVLRNGVRRSTRPMRQNRILAKVLSDPDCGLHPAAIRVLELPCSTGVAALDNVVTLSGRYGIHTYVLGDLSFQLYYDLRHECIFDEAFNLLQVKGKKHFFSIYRPARSGQRYSRLSAALLYPFELMSRHLKRRYAHPDRGTLVPINILHPDVQTKVNAGELLPREMDVFKEIPGRYDVILCFNLLLRAYFSPDAIAHGVANLTNALDEQGLLIMGDETSFSVARKVDGRLMLIRQEGRF
jgi:hypothetical protein